MRFRRILLALSAVVFTCAVAVFGTTEPASAYPYPRHPPMCANAPTYDPRVISAPWGQSVHMGEDQCLYWGDKMQVVSLGNPRSRLYELEMQGDGNFVLYVTPFDMQTGWVGPRSPLWATDWPHYGDFVAMQGDGNLVLYDYQSGYYVPTWSSDTWGCGDRSFLALQPDGNVVVYDHGGSRATWSRRSGRLVYCH